MSVSVRVVSYNIHKGFSFGSRAFVLDAMKRAIDSIDADLVFLQEVIGENTRHAQRVKNWPSTSQFEFLADSLWPHHAYGRNAVFDEGHHGNAILSKFRIINWYNQDISAHRFERRGLLHAELKLSESQNLHCFCVHLGLTAKGRKTQLEKICKQIITTIPAEAPLIVAGDFNDWGITASRILREHLGLIEVFEHSKGRHAATFPAFLPVLHLDRIYVRGLEVRSVKVLRGRAWKQLSDHAALSADLVL